MAYDIPLTFEDLPLFSPKCPDGKPACCALVKGSCTLNMFGRIDSIALEDFHAAGDAECEVKKTDALYPIIETAIYANLADHIRDAVSEHRIEAGGPWSRRSAA